jgi:hypothetical protein
VATGRLASIYITVVRESWCFLVEAVMPPSRPAVFLPPSELYALQATKPVGVSGD